jgi:uncharacterized protein YkwD
MRLVCATIAAFAVAPAPAAGADVPVPPAAPAAPVIGLLPPPPSLAPAVQPSVAVPPIAAVAAACNTRGRRAAARRAAVRCLVDSARARAGLRGFRGSRALSRAAARHARDMVRGRYFAHQRAGGPSLERRVRAAGWRRRSVGEAIAYGCGSSRRPVEIVRMWLASPPHAAILLSRDLSHAGVGVAGRPPLACGGRGATYVLDAG